MKHIAKRSLALLLCLLLCLGMLPGSAMAEDARTQETESHCHDPHCAGHCEDGECGGHCKDEACTAPEQVGTTSELTLLASNDVAEPDATTKRCPDCRTRMTLQTEDATCEDDGYTYYECDNCGYYEEVDTIPALGHDYQLSYHEDASCVDWGYSYYECTLCGDWYEEDDEEPTGIHTWEYDYEDVFPEEGYRVIHSYCEVCDEPKEEQEPIQGICVYLEWDKEVDLDLSVVWNNQSDYDSYSHVDDAYQHEYVLIDSPADGTYQIEVTDCTSNWGRGDYDTYSHSVHASVKVWQDGELKGSCVLPDMWWGDPWIPCTFDIFEGNVINICDSANTRLSVSLEWENASLYMDYTLYRNGNDLMESYADDRGHYSTIAFPLDGSYELFVYNRGVDDFFDRSEFESLLFASSGATVKVWQGGELLATYTIPENMVWSDVWKVCSFEVSNGIVGNFQEIPDDNIYLVMDYTNFGEDDGNYHNLSVEVLKNGSGQNLEEHPITEDLGASWGRVGDICVLPASSNGTYDVRVYTDEDLQLIAPYAPRLRIFQNGELLATYMAADYELPGAIWEVVRLTVSNGTANNLNTLSHNFVRSHYEPDDCYDYGWSIYTCSVCGDYYEVDDEEQIGHDWELVGRIEPVCGMDGTVLYACRRCGISNAETIPCSARHSYVETYRQEPQHEVPGFVVYTCSNCGVSYTETLDTLSGHDYELTSYEEPTCTDWGVKTYTCRICDDSYQERVQPTNEHAYYLESSIPATCTSYGTDHYVCKTCERSYDTHTNPTGEHSYELVHHQDAGCAERGWNEYRCVVCNQSYTEYIAITGRHRFYVESEKQPFGDEDGYVTYRCSGCGTTYTTRIAATGEENVDEEGHFYYLEHHTEPTCMGWGESHYVCAICGEEYSIYHEPTGVHTYTSYYHQDARCTCEDGQNQGIDRWGYTQHLCRDCDWSIWVWEEPTHSHSYYLDYHAEPTCNEWGYDSFVCQSCGAEYKDYSDYAPTGNHELYLSSYEFETCRRGGMIAYTCKHCGWVEEEYVEPSGVHRYELNETVEPDEDVYGWERWRCADCGDEKYVYLPPTDNSLMIHSGHEIWSVSSSEADCNDFGSVSFYCEDCNEWCTVETAPPTGEHDWVLDDSGEPGCEYHYYWWYSHPWGWETWLCNHCGKSYTVDTAAPTHQHHWEISNQHEPGCSDGDYGYTDYQCSECSKSYRVYAPPSGNHDWYEYEVYDGDCDEWGYTTYRCWDCGTEYKVYQVPPTDAHDLYVSAHQDPTCQDWGYDEYSCWNCDYRDLTWVVWYRMMIPPTGEHDYQLVEHQDATCEDNGWDYYECSTCDRWKEITIPALGHDYQIVERVEPSNGRNGYILYQCSRCDSSYSETIYPPDHEHVQGEAQIENNIDPTCTGNGVYDLVTRCAVCGEVLSSEHVTLPPLGHSFSETERVEPSGGQPGYIRYCCTRCGFWYDEEIPAPTEDNIRIVLTWGQTPRDLDSHLYIYDTVEEAVNTEGDSVFTYNGNRGHTAYYSKQYYENSRLTADLDRDDVTSYGPETTTIYTPVSDGIYLFKVHDYTNRDNFASRALSNSGATVSLFIGDDPWLDSDGNPYVFHVPENTIGCNWAVFYLEAASNTVRVLNTLDQHRLAYNYYPATCTTWGETVSYCLDCGAVTSEIDESAPPLGHDYVETSRVEATEEDGWIEYTCTRCGDSYEVILPAPVHDYVETNRQDPTCTEWGWIEYTCNNHGETIIENLPPIGHNYIVHRVVAPNCTEQGYTVYRCANCGDSYTSDFVDALNHDFQNGFCTRCGEPDPFGGRRIVVASTSGCEGSIITVPITLENNPGIASMRLLIQYDDNVLELEHVALGDAFRTAPSAQYLLNTTVNPVVLNWLMMTDKCDADGVFATLTFKVLSADAGETAVTAAYEQADVYGGNMENVVFEVVNSTITLGVHSLYYVAGTPATCTAAGEREHWYCGVCGRIYADANAEMELSESELVVAALGHLPGSSVIENRVDATCTAGGSYDTVVYCQRCGAEMSRVTTSLPPLGHDYDYYTGVCTRCGAQDPTFPTENSPTFRILPASGTVGREVVVTLRLEHNPGLASAKPTLRYDATKLAFQHADLTEFSNVQGVNFTATEGADGLTLNYNLTSGELTGDGDFLTVTFMIVGDAEAGDTPLSVTYQREDVFNASGEIIRFYCANANLLVKLRITGDVNGDGRVNNKDARLLFQFVSNVVLTQTFYVDAADVNGDGRVNNKDARLLFQYVSGIPVVLV